MAQSITADFIERERASSTPRAARVIGTAVFSLLLALIVFTAIPYGTAHAWWKALFVAALFLLAIPAIVELMLNESWATDGCTVLLPVLTLALFSLLQSVSIGTHAGNAGLGVPVSNAVSFDPFHTRFFVLQLLALTLAGFFLFRYASTERHMRVLINVVIGVAVATALFGILRQTMQHGSSFGLPFPAADVGYGQFINKNHFAFLMEMGFGLSLGMILGGAKKDQTLMYFAAILPIWTALVLSGSRGGLVAMVAQVIIAALLFGMIWRSRDSYEPRSRIARVARSLPVRLALLLVLVAGILFGTFWVGGDRLATKIEQSRTELEADTATRQGVRRNEVWRATWRMFSAHPILGVGLNGYWIAVPQYHDASGTMTPQEAHNDYLELLASGGIVGFAIGLWFAVVVYRRTRENLDSPNRFRRAACLGAAVGIAGVAVHSLVDFGLHMIVNAVVFTTLVVIATSKPHWTDPKYD